MDVLCFLQLPGETACRVVRTNKGAFVAEEYVPSADAMGYPHESLYGTHERLKKIWALEYGGSNIGHPARWDRASPRRAAQIFRRAFSREHIGLGQRVVAWQKGQEPAMIADWRDDYAWGRYAGRDHGRHYMWTFDGAFIEVETIEAMPFCKGERVRAWTGERGFEECAYSWRGGLDDVCDLGNGDQLVSAVVDLREYPISVNGKPMIYLGYQDRMTVRAVRNRHRHLVRDLLGRQSWAHTHEIKSIQGLPLPSRVVEDQEYNKGRSSQ